MKRLFQILLLTATFLWVSLPSTYAQISDDFDSIENMIIYSHERFGQAIAHNLGLGMGYRMGKNINAFNTRVFSFELVTMRSPKQIKTINPYYSNSRRYVYGKMNDVIVARAGFGYRKLLNGKPYWGGVEVRWIYEIGASLAIEKPYYLYVVKINQSSGGAYLYDIVTEQFDPDISWDDIYGRAPYSKGLNEITVVPGAFFRSGFSFEFGEIKTKVKAIEAGVMLDFFPAGVTVMAESSYQPAFLTFYIGFSFGNRMNKY